MNRIFVPPIKCQGIKTKLVKHIRQLSCNTKYSRWIEPFLGSGVVGFNIHPSKAVYADNNPHIIRFYQDIQKNIINQYNISSYLSKEGAVLQKSNGDYYYEIRDRFNKNPNSFDFIFLNRACFNGMMRFNSKKEFNVPFCNKPDRFSQAYITKIAHQVKNIQDIITHNDYAFLFQPFELTLKDIRETDLVYCDPPYIGRHNDYFDSWNDKSERLLFNLLSSANSRFILSTWHSNDFRSNEYIQLLWNAYNINIVSHFYHVGAKEVNRNPVYEALITNFITEKLCSVNKVREEVGLFDLVKA